MDFFNPMVANYHRGLFRDKLEEVECKQLVIFLDIDGVIQPYSAEARHVYDLEALCAYLSGKYQNDIYTRMDKYDVGAAYYDWDTLALARIRELAKLYNAAIVLHTGWCRFNNLEKMKALFALYGMDDMIVTQVDGKKDKADGILDFLEQNPGIRDYIVIDDDGRLGEAFAAHFIETNNRFTEQNYKKVYDYFAQYEYNEP